MGVYFVGNHQGAGNEDDTVTIQADSDEFSEPQETKRQLEKDLRQTQANAYAGGTLKNLVCQWKSFFRFYKCYNIREWPASEHTICLNAQFLGGLSLNLNHLIISIGHDNL